MLLLLSAGFKCFGQVSTFSLTYPDTMNLDAGSERCVEFKGYYYCSSNHIGLSFRQGSVLRILKIGLNGESVGRYWVFDTTRRYLESPIILGSKSEFILCVGRSVKGSSQPRSLVIKWISTDLQEIQQFENPDSTEFDTPEAILEAGSGRIYAVGTRAILGTVPSNKNGFILVLEADGSLVNFNVIDEGRNEFFTSIVPCVDGGFFLGGATSSFGGNQGYLVKIDADGNKLWMKHYPEYSTMKISSYSDTSIIFSGFQVIDIGILSNNISLADTSGNIKWTKSYDYPNRLNQYITHKTKNEGLITVGLTNSAPQNHDNAGYISRHEADGTLLWQRHYNYNAETDFFVDVIETSDGGFLVNGAAFNDDTGQDLWLVKLDSMGCLEPNCWEVGIEDAKENELGIKVFPNPAAEWINFKLPVNSGDITLEMFTISGKRVMNTKLFAPLEAIQVGHLPMGLYLAKLTNSDGTVSTQKIVIAR